MPLKPRLRLTLALTGDEAHEMAVEPHHSSAKSNQCQINMTLENVDTNASVSDAMAAVEISDAAPDADTDAAKKAAAEKKAEENRKKRERQKKKKAAEKADGVPATTPVDTAADTMNRWSTGKLPGGRAERRACAEGGTRGLGVFALDGMNKEEIVCCAQPALSCIFDAACQTVCSFCFDSPAPGSTTEHPITLTSAEPGADGNRSGGFGIKLDDYKPETGSGPIEPLITVVTKESPNRELVRIGDRVASINGVPISGGHEAAAPLLLEGAKANNGKVEVVIRRPALVVCPGCKKLAACAKCVGDGCLAWHAYECALYRQLPPKAVQGETATLRLLLRYSVATNEKVGDWPSITKEPVPLLTSLQANACDVPPEQLIQLSKLTGVSSAAVASLIFQIRTNAAEITRSNKKVGCALSVLMGWHNHDCAPNARSVIEADGSVQIQSLKEIKDGEEVTISYVDPKLPYEERRKTLLKHYGFECRCARCLNEQRSELKTKMKQRDQYLQAQRR